jgi:CHASE2 domain-containing sensor protein
MDYVLLVLPFFTAFAVTFSEAFIKCFQSRNIAQGKEWTAAATSVLVTCSMFATFGLFVYQGYAILVPCAIGGAVGTMLSIRFHKRLFKDH